MLESEPVSNQRIGRGNRSKKYYSSIRDHSDHDSAPQSVVRLSTKLEHMPAIGTEVDDGKDLLPSRIGGSELDLAGVREVKTKREDG